MLHGIDVSHWQSGMRLADADADFVIIKATDGTNFFDPAAVDFYQQARAAGLLIGAYHFYEGDPVAEADYFVAHVREVVGEVLLVLDFETHTSDVAGAKAFLDRVYDKTGVRPLIYMSQSVTVAHDWSAVAAHYPLWVARYGTSSYGDTGAWAEPIMWQFTDAYHTAGHDVDGDYFYGDHSDWMALASGAGGGNGGDDDMPDYKNQTNAQAVTITGDGTWHGLQIGDDDDDAKYNFLTGPVYTTGVLHVTFEAPEGTEVHLRVISADTKSGQDTQPVSQFPLVEYRAASGQTQVVLPFANSIGKAASGWNRRMRFQVRASGNQQVKIVEAKARGLYWER
jgi:lysozyme